MTQFVREERLSAVTRDKSSHNPVMLSLCHTAWLITRQNSLLLIFIPDNAITLLFYDPHIHVSVTILISLAFDIHRSVTVSSISTYFKMLKYFVFIIFTK